MSIHLSIRVYAIDGESMSVIITKYRWNRLKCGAESGFSDTVAVVWVENYRKGTTRRENKHNSLGLDSNRVASLFSLLTQCMDNKRHFTVHIFYKLYVQSNATCAYWSRTFSNSYIAFMCAHLETHHHRCWHVPSHTHTQPRSLYFHTWIHLITALAFGTLMCIPSAASSSSSFHFFVRSYVSRFSLFVSVFPSSPFLSLCICVAKWCPNVIGGGSCMCLMESTVLPFSTCIIFGEKSPKKDNRKTIEKIAKRQTRRAEQHIHTHTIFTVVNGHVK